MGPWASRDGTGASSTSGWRPPGTPIDRLCLDVCLLRESSVARTSSFDSTENCSVRSRPIVFWLSRHPGGHAEHSALILVQGASRVSSRRSATCACPRRSATCARARGGVRRARVPAASVARGVRHPRGPGVSFARSATSTGARRQLRAECDMGRVSRRRNATPLRDRSGGARKNAWMGPLRHGGVGSGRVALRARLTSSRPPRRTPRPFDVEQAATSHSAPV